MSEREGRIVGTVLFRVRTNCAPSLEFVEGPLPLPWGLQGEGTPSLRTDADLRQTYIALHAGPSLYGANEESDRSHAFVPISATDSDSGGDGIAEITALELHTWATGADGSEDGIHVLVIHLQAEGLKVLDAVIEICRPSAPGKSWPVLGMAEEATGASWTIVGNPTRLGSLLLMTTPDGVPLTPATRPGNDWTELEQAMWSVASLAPYDRYPPDHTDPDLLQSTIHLSATWRALVLRDGVGFIGCSPSSDPFFPSAEALVRTVYTDVLLLAKLQRETLADLAASLASIDHRETRSDDLTSIVDRATMLRNRLWWDDVTSHGHGNALLRAAQSELASPQLFKRVNEDLATFRAEVGAHELSLLRESQDRERDAQLRLERRQNDFESLLKRSGAALATATLTIAFFGVNLTHLTDGDGVSWPYVVGGTFIAGMLGWAVASIAVRARVDEEDVP